MLDNSKITANQLFMSLEEPATSLIPISQVIEQSIFTKKVIDFSDFVSSFLPIKRLFHQGSGQRSGRCSVSWTAPTAWLLWSAPGREICQIHLHIQSIKSASTFSLSTSHALTIKQNGCIIDFWQVDIMFMYFFMPPR